MLARGAAAQNLCPVLGAAHPCPSLACHLASAPLGTSWDLPQVSGRCVVPDTQVRAVSGVQHMRLPGPAPAPESGWWEGSRPPDSKPPGLSVQIHQWSDFFCEDTVSTSQDEARANQTCCPWPGYGDLGSAGCHPARQLWSWLVRGKPSRKHHQLRVRRAKGIKGVGARQQAACVLEGREHPEGPPKHEFTRRAVGSLGEKKQDVCSGGFTAQNGTPMDWTRLREVAVGRGGGAPGHPDLPSKAPGWQMWLLPQAAPVAKPLRVSEARVLVSGAYLSPTLLPKDGSTPRFGFDPRPQFSKGTCTCWPALSPRDRPFPRS